MAALPLVLVSEGQGDILIVRVICTCGRESESRNLPGSLGWGAGGGGVGVGVGRGLRDLGSPNPCTQQISGDKR